MRALDLFAGPGGWDVAAAQLGIHPLGIELDDAACATRKAAGRRTLQGDVAALNPADFAPCDLLIASPPCQAWSMAGKRGGEADKGLVYELTEYLRSHDFGHNPDIWRWQDERSRLVTEPLRWALTLRPRFIALEQVPPVLDYWKHIAEILRGEGYGVWTGILEAERYGVPQTRERAILMAELDGNPHPPAPTHQRYIPGEPARHDVTLEGEILPWVSMAEALGWTQGGSVQTNNFTAKQRDLDGSRTKNGSVPYERGIEAPAPTIDTHVGQGWRVGYHRTRGEGMKERHGERRTHPVDEPAPTLTEKARSDEWRPLALRAGTNANDVARPADEPAPTIRYGERMNDVSWVEERPAPTIVTTRRSDQGIIVGRQLPEGEGRNVGGHGWTEDRPSTAVCADPRISPPGYRGRAEDYDAEGNYKGKRSMDNAVRVTVEEASILQGFDPAYPWKGSRTKQFQQIGNAVPPPLARAVLTELCASALPQDRKEAA